MKIVTILGARPQFIKAGTVSRAIYEYNQTSIKNKKIEEVIIHTGQHFDVNMSDIFFNEMQIPKPDYNFNINGMGHGAMTGKMLEKIEEILVIEKPDWVMVYGDTNSTLAGALAASKLHIKIAHIEAGLRSFNMRMPEELNRILTDRISNILFCPTETAVQNLKNEGYETQERVSTENFKGFGKVVNVGDVMQDGAEFYKSFAQKPKTVEKFNLKEKNYVLCTIHRAENTDDSQRLYEIFEALTEISKDIQVILPLHPRTKERLKALNFKCDTLNIHMIDPVGYLNMIWLIDNCKFIMTDSGGLQKEAFFFRKPCITLRDETEWVELVENGFNMIVGASKNTIIESYKFLVSSVDLKQLKSVDYNMNLYGGGKASKTIIKQLLEF